MQWPLLKKRWKTVVFCLLMQYVHGIFTQLAARFHVATPEPLRDAGFMLTPVCSCPFPLASSAGVLRLPMHSLLALPTRECRAVS